MGHGQKGLKYLLEHTHDVSTHSSILGSLNASCISHPYIMIPWTR